MPRARSRSPGYLQLLSNLATNQRFLWPPPTLDQINLLGQLTELRETFTFVHQLIKRYDKRYRWTVRWREIWRTLSGLGGSWVQELLSVWVGVHHAPSTWMCAPTWKLSEPHIIGIFMEALSCRHDRSLTPFSALLRSQENGRRGWKVQASNHGLFFLVTSPHPGAHPELLH